MDLYKKEQRQQQQRSYDYLDMVKDKYLDKSLIKEQRSINKAQLLKDLKHNEILSCIDLNYKNIMEKVSSNDMELSIDYKDGCICLDPRESNSNFKYEKDISLFLKSLCPWRKGPFRVLSTFIDAEWRSDLKWNRIEPFLSDISGKRVLDLGCNNGYFMFRLLSKNPSLVIGVDTFSKNLYSFNFFNHFIKNKVLFFELFSAEYTKYYHNFFNTVLCLGLLYHLKDPISLLHSIHNSLVKGGKIILECQGIDGEGSIALCPDGRYNGCSGIWYLPTRECLISWLKRADFKDIRCFYDEYLTEDEQRSTEWAKVKSFSDFFDKKTQKTVEGYPRARRIYIIAKK